MKFNVNNPAFLQEAGAIGKPVKLFYVTSSVDGNDVMFVNTKLGAFSDNVQYSTDNAATWNQLTADTVITLDAGETVYFRNYTGEVYNLASGTPILVTSDMYSVGGDITALFYPKTKQLPAYAFKDAFASDENIEDASMLLLKATALAEYCYANMFSGCTSLTSAPELPATALAESCYDSMFSGCTSLTYIECLAESVIDSAVESWVGGVAASGTFTKAAGVEWPTGANGIPDGWNVVEA